MLQGNVRLKLVPSPYPSFKLDPRQTNFLKNDLIISHFLCFLSSVKAKQGNED